MDCFFRENNRYSTNGFTLAEFLIVLAVMAILSCVGIPTSLSLYNNWKIAKLDEYSREIYLAAQNKLTTMQATGSISVLDTAESFTSSQPYIDNDKFVTVSYLKSSDPLMATFLPEGSLTLNGDYVIEFDRDTAAVLSVYYVEDGHFTYSVESNRVTTLYDGKKYTRNMSRETRKNQKIYVGFYGEMDVERPEVEEEEVRKSIARIVDDVNNNILYAIVYTSETTGNATFRLKTADGTASKSISFALSALPYTDTTETLASECAIGGVWNKKLVCRLEDGKTVNAYVVLLDSLKEGKRFKNINEFKNAVGKDITIDRVLIDEQETELDFELVNCRNSLFDTLDPETATAHIKSARHLQNLAADRALTSEHLNGSGYVKNTASAYYVMTNAVMDNDIVWPETEVFYPITNNRLMKFNGGNYSISKVNIVGNVVSEIVIPTGGTHTENPSFMVWVDVPYKYVPVGLFGWFGGDELKNLKLVDCKISYPVKPNLNITHVGMLAGVVDPSLKALVIDNCHVYGESPMKEVKTDCIQIADGVMNSVNSLCEAGGLIGEIRYKNYVTTVQNCSVSLTDMNVGKKQNNETINTCGGIVGKAKAATIERCYADIGIFTDDEWIGGIDADADYCGNLAGDLDAVKVRKCYGTGFNSIDTGLVGHLEIKSEWKIEDSYEAGVYDKGNGDYRPVSNLIGTPGIWSTILTMYRTLLTNKIENTYVLAESGKSDLNNSMNYLTYSELSELQITGFEKAAVSTTHRYGQKVKKYPFPKLTDAVQQGNKINGSMDHYGDWPNKPVIVPDGVVMAYYEVYKQKNADKYYIGFYYPNLADTLLYGNDLTNYDIIQDGYAALLEDIRIGTKHYYAGIQSWNANETNSWYYTTNPKIGLKLINDTDQSEKTVTFKYPWDFRYNGKEIVVSKSKTTTSALYNNKTPTKITFNSKDYIPIFLDFDTVIDGNYNPDSYLQHLCIYNTNGEEKFEFRFNPHFAKAGIFNHDPEEDEMDSRSLIRTERQFARLLKSGSDDIAQRVYTNEEMNIVLDRNLNYDSNVYTTNYFGTDLNKVENQYARTLTGMIASEDGYPFRGSFNGKDHTIKGIARSASAYSLFGNVEGGTVKNTVLDKITYADGVKDAATLIHTAENADISNITITNASIKGDGIVAGMAANADNCTIADVKVNGNIRIENNGETTGGVFGTVSASDLNHIEIGCTKVNNTDKVEIISSKGVVGGVIGCVENGTKIRNITAGNSSQNYPFAVNGDAQTTDAGGLIGVITNGSHEVTVENATADNIELRAHFKAGEDPNKSDHYHCAGGLVARVDTKADVTLDQLKVKKLNVKVHVDKNEVSGSVIGGGAIGLLKSEGQAKINVAADNTTTLEYKTENGLVGGYVGCIDIDKEQSTLTFSAANNAKLVFASDDNIETVGGVIGVINNGEKIAVNGETAVIALGADKKLKTSSVGGLYGMAKKKVTIDSDGLRIPLTGQVALYSADHVDSYFGGMTGVYDGIAEISEKIVPVISDVTVEGNDRSYVGGFTGKNTALLNKAYTVEVNKLTTKKAVATGGFVAQAAADLRNGKVVSVNNTSEIKAQGYVGGFVGKSDADISLASVDLKVTGDKAKAIGGFVGIVNSGTITRSVSLGNVPNVNSSLEDRPSSLSTEKNGNNRGGFAGDYRVTQPKTAAQDEQRMADCAMLLEDLFRSVKVSVAKVDGITDRDMTDRKDIDYFRSYCERFETYTAARIAYMEDPADAVAEKNYRKAAKDLGYLDPTRIVGTSYDSDERPYIRDVISSAYDSTIVGTAEKILRRKTTGRLTNDTGLLTFDILNALNGVNSLEETALTRYRELIEKYGFETFEALQFDVVWHVSDDGRTFYLLEGTDFNASDPYAKVYRNDRHIFGVYRTTARLNSAGIILTETYGKKYNALDPESAGITAYTYVLDSVANTPFERCFYAFSTNTMSPMNFNRATLFTAKHTGDWSDFSDQKVVYNTTDLSRTVTQYGVDGIYREESAAQYAQQGYPNIDDNAKITKYEPSYNTYQYNVNLAWDDDSNRDGIRPATFSIATVLRSTDGSYRCDKAITQSSTAGKYTYATVFKGARKIPYVLEVNTVINGYEPKIERSATGFTVKMVHIPETKTMSFIGDFADERDLTIYVDRNHNNAADTSEIVETIRISNREPVMKDLMKNENGSQITYSYEMKTPAETGMHYEITTGTDRIEVHLVNDISLSTEKETAGITEDDSVIKETSEVTEEPTETKE